MLKYLPIILFIIAGIILLYALILLFTRDIDLIPRGYMAKTNNKRAYTGKIAGILCMVAASPLISAVVALFNIYAGAMVLVVTLVLAIWIASKLGNL